MHEQRTADAAIASPPDDPTDARSEAPLLELSPIPVWPPEKAVSVPSLGFGITHVRLLDTASIRPSRVDARTVNYSDSCVRQSQECRETNSHNHLFIKNLRRKHGFPNFQKSPKT